MAIGDVETMNLLAFDTGTEVISVALRARSRAGCAVGSTTPQAAPKRLPI